MTLTLGDVESALSIVQAVLLPVVGWVAKMLFDQRKVVRALEGRVGKLEICLDNAPSEAALHELAISITGLRGDLAVTVQKIDGLGQVVARMEQVVDRHEEYLLNGGKR